MSGSPPKSKAEARPFDLGLLGPGDGHFDEALRLILCGVHEPHPEADQRVADLRAVVRRQGLRMDLLLAALAADRLVGAVLAVESPGATALVYAPPGEPPAEQRQVLIALLAELCRRAWSRGLALLQTLLWPHEAVRPAIFAEAGFRHLAELIYMDRPVQLPSPGSESDLTLRFETYGSRRHPLFIEALERSYVDSLDCPALSGLRRTEDIIAGHQATGVYDPDCWFMAAVGGEPAGVLLTSRVIARPALEVAYMGVCPAFRGRGVGGCLMARALECARGLGVEEVTLAVDGLNEPARRLYNRWGFVERCRRRAWIASPSGPGRDAGL